MNRRICFVFVLASGLAFRCAPSSDEDLSTAFRAVDYRQVKVGGELGRRMDLAMHKNIPGIDLDSVFLEHFRNRSARPAVRDGFVGAGMLLDAVVGFAYYSMDPEMIRRKEYLAEELVKTQEPDGYIGIFTEEKRQGASWDTHEGSYIMLGLTNDFLLFGEERSLEAARKYADYLIKRKAGVIAGLDEALLQLYRATGDGKYLDYCIHEIGLPDFQFRDLNQTRHVYGYLDRALQQLNLFEIQPDRELLYKPHVAVEFLVNIDALDVIGGAGMYEHFNTSHNGRECNAETCATAFVVWLMSALIRTEGYAFYGDIMERSIYNALFAAFSPSGDSIRYFTNYESAREYYPDDYFCCPNNFRRIISDIPGLIYYRSDNGVAVNLYNNSEVCFEVGDQTVRLLQETDYPASGEVILTVEPEEACEFEIKLRIPLWCEDPTVSVNGAEWKAEPVPGNFFTIARRWEKGEQVRLSFPMEYRFVRGRGNQWDKVALMRGPVVYGIGSKENPGVHEEMVLTIDPASISGPVPDSSFRPGGVKCTARLTDGITGITFTEFIDPSGIKTFFYIPEGSGMARDDELVARQYNPVRIKKR